MKLTGKAKELFEEWYSEHSIRIRSDYNGMLSNPTAFNSLNPMFQWGVYQDWADSLKGGRMEVYAQNNGYNIIIQTEEKYCSFQSRGNRQEARNAAIEKLNELIN